MVWLNRLLTQKGPKFLVDSVKIFGLTTLLVPQFTSIYFFLLCFKNSQLTMGATRGIPLIFSQKLSELSILYFFYK
jgi:hypothetical protein